MKRQGRVPEDAPLGGMPTPAFMLSSEGFCDARFSGFITHPLVTCRTATFWLNHAMNVLKDKLDIPGMSAQGDIVDLTVFDASAALSQVPAFEESMEHFRKVRKEKGLAW